MEDILKFLEEAKVFYLATVEDGEPRVRPLGFFMSYEDRLYFGIGDYKPCYSQLKLNPHFEVCAYDNKTRWLRIRGSAVFDERPEVNAYIFKNNDFLNEKYGEGSDLTHAPFYAEDVKATFYEFGDKEWTVNL